MKLLGSHHPLEDAEISSFANFADEFFEIWIDVFGEAGVTNYIHMVGCGHMTSFLKRYKCLNPLSQQGWEGLNNKVTTYFHLCTQRGGRNSNGASGKSYIKPIIDFLLRDLLWKTGEADKYVFSNKK
jgi:hypothetical protein